MKYIINGGKPLMGSVRLGGAKNASFKLMIAASLANSESRLLNLSKIGDVHITQKTLEALGCQTHYCGERTMFIKPCDFSSVAIPQVSGEKSRASTLFASALLARKGEAIIPHPGGCVLGERPIDRHLEAICSLGVKVKKDSQAIHLKADKLVGATYRFSKKTHTGTEAFILAAVKAEGQTIIENAGLEPEIDDLILFLNHMGAQIKRASNDRIIIDGVPSLKGTFHRVMPDRNEAVSYAVAALATRGDIIIEDARPTDLKYFLAKLDEINAGYEILDYGIRFFYKSQLKACDIKTSPEPGFMTDWQPLWTILMTQAQGTSHVIEAVHNNRLQFATQLNQMGAKIELYSPKVSDPDKYYEFDDASKDANLHAARISGPTQFQPMKLTVPDLRAGATLTIAALIAKGKSEISDIHHIERGYEDLDGHLRQLGADIEKVE